MRSFVLAVVVVVGLTACLPDTGPAPTDDPYQRALYDLVNRDRAADGLAPLAFSPKLSVLAGGHACEMARERRLFHSDLYATLYYNADFAGYGGLGENVAVVSGDTSPGRLQAAWMGSPGHRANVLSSLWTLVGIAVCWDSGLLWAVQDFGVLR